MFAEDDIARRKADREAADRIYNEALTALDRALPALPELPHPPVAYDEQLITPLNEHWTILQEQPDQAFSGWRLALARFVWELVRPVFSRQQTFNALSIDHLNRNVAVHRSHAEAVVSTLGALRAELEKLDTFHAKLILYLQTMTLYIDTKDRSEHIAMLANLVTDLASAGLNGISNEFQRQAESMVAREQRYMSAVDELRTSIATVQQTGLTLKRELERFLSNGVPTTAPVTARSGDETSSGLSTPLAPAATAQADAVTGNLNAYKYVGFENKFRGSETDIRERQLGYVKLFEGASDVLDLGCGRGEFLSVLREGGISAHGLDINHEMVEICRELGLAVHEGDGLAYLNGLPDGSLGGLIAAQVVEHFPPPYLLQFLDVAFHKLRPGSTIVLETLNPSSWVAFFEAYIRDITHAWPLHPDTLKYLVVASGFQHVDVTFMSPYPANSKLLPCPLPQEATSLGMANLAYVFNENVNKVNALMFGDQDYAVVAKRI